jgi:hypothetical protein
MPAWWNRSVATTPGLDRALAIPASARHGKQGIFAILILRSDGRTLGVGLRERVTMCVCASAPAVPTDRAAPLQSLSRAILSLARSASRARDRAAHGRLHRQPYVNERFLGCAELPRRLAVKKGYRALNGPPGSAPCLDFGIDLDHARSMSCGQVGATAASKMAAATLEPVSAASVILAT